MAGAGPLSLATPAGAPGQTSWCGGTALWLLRFWTQLRKERQDPPACQATSCRQLALLLWTAGWAVCPLLTPHQKGTSHVPQGSELP